MRHIQQHTIALHAPQHLLHRQFQILINRQQACISSNAREKRVVHLQRDVRIFCGIGCGHIQRHLLKTDGVYPFACYRFIRNGVAI